MKKPKFSSGFSLMEAIIGLALLTMVGALLSRVFVNTTRSVVQTKNNQKASYLADMVLEQYAGYAVTNFSRLAQYNTSQATAKQFFSATDNMGYPFMAITSTAIYSADRLTCQVDVTIDQKVGDHHKSSKFSRTFSERTPVFSGSAVKVYVKAPCAGKTTKDEIIADCTTGLAGFNVRAPSNIPGYVNRLGEPDQALGTTNGEGMAMVRNVKAGLITLSISKPASAWSVSPNAPNFSQGYYTLDSGGSPTMTQSMDVFVEIEKNAVVLSTGFMALAHISGTLVNNSPAIVCSTGPIPAGGPVDGFEITLLGSPASRVWTGSDLAGLNPARWTVVTNNGGQFGFGNLLPGSAEWAITIRGSMGSGVKISPTDPNFAWGYANAGHYRFTLSPQATVLGDHYKFGESGHPTVTITRMGALILRMFDIDNNPLLSSGGVFKSFMGLNDPHQAEYHQLDPGCSYGGCYSGTDGSNETWFYNVFVSSTLPNPLENYTAWIESSLAGNGTAANPGYFGLSKAPCVMQPGIINICDSVLERGLHAMIHVRDTSPSAVGGIPPSDLTAMIWVQSQNNSLIFPVTPGTGDLEFWGLPPGYAGNPTAFQFGRAGGTTGLRITGTVRDRHTGQTVPDLQLDLRQGYISGNDRTDSGGSFDLDAQMSWRELHNGYAPYDDDVWDCGATPYTAATLCTFMPNPAGPVEINSTYFAYFNFDASYTSDGTWKHEGSAHYPTGANPLSIGGAVDAVLVRHMIKGTIRHGTTGLQGVVVKDSISGGLSAPTDSNGYYEIMCAVQDGHQVALEIPGPVMATNTGLTYVGTTSGYIELDSPRTPASGKTVNFTLVEADGGSGGV